ncbi:MAG TPA: ankyrin repeat domain-containing protein [Spirochaetota bacterium]|nr:ankyrin repeat domain-containing protein [Spirochaetota bacterium]HOM37777.1 ankyrin repeat domain-containing protein [Spirochaetota bacterium]HPQ49346.1 ankyrin repeat domain-containing protein [Spirochaetota bacterium]
MRNKIIIFLLFLSFVCYGKMEDDFIDAVKTNDLERTKSLIHQGVNINYKDKDGFTALHHAVINNNLKMINLILRENSPFIPTDRFLLSVPVVALSVILFIVIAAILAVFYSHKLAGPVYRIEKSILKIINGAHNFRVTLRKKDEFKNLADTFNKLIDYVDKHYKIIENVKSLIKNYEETGNKDFIKKAEEIINSHVEERL